MEKKEPKGSKNVPNLWKEAKKKKKKSEKEVLRMLQR